jgi:hypothetical protein
MFFINPFIYAGGGDFESIATVTVGSGGAANVTFSSIPSTYQHLQIRMIARSTASGSSAGATSLLRFNSDTGSNYSQHYLYGQGSSASAAGVASQTAIQAGLFPQTSATASAFGGVVIDILDYTSTSKNTTVRTLEGSDLNGSGGVAIRSGAWFSTAAVTDIVLIDHTGNNFAQYSTAALYGVKAP